MLRVFRFRLSVSFHEWPRLIHPSPDLCNLIDSSFKNTNKIQKSLLINEVYDYIC